MIYKIVTYLVLIILIIIAYNYYKTHRNYLSFLEKSNKYPILCKECKKDIVTYVKYVDNKIYNKLHVDKISNLIIKGCKKFNLPLNICKYLDFSKDFPQEKIKKIYCCTSCYNNKYLNTNLSEWEVWKHYSNGYIPSIDNNHGVYIYTE